MQSALKVRIAALSVSIATAIGLVAVLTTGRTTHPTLPALPDGSLSEAVDVEAVLAHVTRLQAIADSNSGSRMSASAGFEASAQYVEQVLTEAGYQTERQSFTFEVDLLAESTLSQHAPRARILAHVPMSATPATPEGGVQGEVVAPAEATGCSASSYPADAAGKVALTARGVCSFAQKSTVAAEVGAVALIVYNNETGPLRGGLGLSGAPLVPTTGISQADGESLLTDLTTGSVVLRFDVQHGTAQRQGFNVLAEASGTEDGAVVMLGAHLDSAPSSPGINDNGSGVAAALEVAVRLAQRRAPKGTVRFAFWGAEEAGLFGSTHYVADLAEHDPTALKAIALYLNLDMLASPNYMVGVYDAPASAVLTDYFDETHQPWVSVDVEGGSDHAPFEDADVPFTGLYTGAMETKSAAHAELFGGAAGVPYDPGYHTPNDNLDNIDPVPLQINLQAAAHAIESVAGA